MGGIPPKDEPEWCRWIEDHGHTNILDRKALAIHYSYGVQQEWIDRSPLLEELQHALVPGRPAPGSFAAQGARLQRILPQLPRAAARKFRYLTGKDTRPSSNGEG